MTALLKFHPLSDCVVVWRLDRLARSLKGLIEISAPLQQNGIQLISLTENIDTSTAGKLFFHIFVALAEFERNLIAERTRAGLAAARARGRSGGRRPALDPDQLRNVQRLLETTDDLASKLEPLERPKERSGE